MNLRKPDILCSLVCDKILDQRCLDVTILALYIGSTPPIVLDNIVCMGWMKYILEMEYRLIIYVISQSYIY